MTTPVTLGAAMAAYLSLVVQPPLLSGTTQTTPVLEPRPIQETAQVMRVDSMADWEETHYLESIPGVGESIREGLATPVSELEKVDLTEFLNLA